MTLTPDCMQSLSLILLFVEKASQITASLYFLFLSNIRSYCRSIH
jgi:hypothetical protein